VQETRLRRTETRSQEGYQEFRDVLRACQPWMDSLNASKIVPESLCRWKRCFFLGLSFLGDQNLQGRQTIFAMKCLGTALSCATVVRHFIWCHTLHSYKHYVTIFAIMRNENGIGHSPDQFFPCGENGLGTKLLKVGTGILWFLAKSKCEQ